MKLFYWIGLTAILLLMGACQEEEAGEVKLTDNCVDFQLRFPTDNDTRAAIKESRQLFWHIFNKRGKRITYYKSMTKNENQSIFVEGLPDGEYSMVVVGKPSNVTDSKTNFLVPENTDDLLMDFNAYLPSDTLAGDIHYNMARFTVVNGNKQQINIELKPVLAQVNFQLQSPNTYLLSTITAVKVTLNESTKAFITADKAYLGERNVKNVDITNSRKLYMLPTSSGTVAGTVEVTAKLVDGELYTSRYKFNVKVTEGEKSVVNVNYTNPESQLGLIRIPRSYYTKTNSLTMMKDDEAGKVLEDPSRRSFIVHTPLQFVVDAAKKKLTMRFFSPIEIRDVKVFAKRRTDTEYFEVLRLDNVPAFIETSLPLAMLTETVSYKTESGKQITITPPKEIKANDYDFKVVCNDMFMQRVAKIKSNFRVSFGMGNPKDPEYSLSITPKQCRHVSVMMMNMCYLFTSNFFWENLAKSKYYADDGHRIGVPEFEARLLNSTQNIVFMQLRTKPGVASVGGANPMFALAGYIMEECHYFDSDYFGGGLYVLYHEFAHCLGYGHSSSMAGKNENMGQQGQFTTFLYYTVFMHFKKHNDMPVLYSSITNNVVNEF